MGLKVIAGPELEGRLMRAFDILLDGCRLSSA